LAEKPWRQLSVWRLKSTQSLIWLGKHSTKFEDDSPVVPMVGARLVAMSAR
jgi:hypothetical protein